MAVPYRYILKRSVREELEAKTQGDHSVRGTRFFRVGLQWNIPRKDFFGGKQLPWFTERWPLGPQGSKQPFKITSRGTLHSNLFFQRTKHKELKNGESVTNAYGIELVITGICFLHCNIYIYLSLNFWDWKNESFIILFPRLFLWYVFF